MRSNRARPRVHFLDSGTLPRLFLFIQKAASRSASLRSARTAEVLAPVLLLHGSPVRFNPCAYSNLVSYADPNLCERARMARTEVEGQRRSLYQTRQCISLHPGHGQGATIRRSIRATELAQDTQPVCPAGHAPTPGPSEGRSALLGYRSKRTIDRHPVQKPSASFPTRSETAQPRHLVLWRQGSHELSSTKTARQF